MGLRKRPTTERRHHEHATFYEIFELNQAFERVIEGLTHMEKVTLFPPEVARETRAEVVLAQVDFNRQFFDKFHEVFEKDEGWACAFTDKSERDARLAEVDRESEAYQQLLSNTVNPTAPLSVQDLRACLEPFAEWEYLDRDDKRISLALICPQISVSRYTVKSIGLNLGWTLPSGDEDSRLSPALNRHKTGDESKFSRAQGY